MHANRTPNYPGGHKRGPPAHGAGKKSGGSFFSWFGPANDGGDDDDNNNNNNKLKGKETTTVKRPLLLDQANHKQKHPADARLLPPTTNSPASRQQHQHQHHAAAAITSSKPHRPGNGPGIFGRAAWFPEPDDGRRAKKEPSAHSPAPPSQHHGIIPPPASSASRGPGGSKQPFDSSWTPQHPNTSSSPPPPTSNPNVIASSSKNSRGQEPTTQRRGDAVVHNSSNPAMQAKIIDITARSNQARPLNQMAGRVGMGKAENTLGNDRRALGNERFEKERQAKEAAAGKQTQPANEWPRPLQSLHPIPEKKPVDPRLAKQQQQQQLERLGKAENANQLHIRDNKAVRQYEDVSVLAASSKKPEPSSFAQRLQRAQTDDMARKAHDSSSSGVKDQHKALRDRLPPGVKLPHGLAKDKAPQPQSNADSKDGLDAPSLAEMAYLKTPVSKPAQRAIDESRDRRHILPGRPTHAKQQVPEFGYSGTDSLAQQSQHKQNHGKPKHEPEILHDKRNDLYALGKVVDNVQRPKHDAGQKEPHKPRPSPQPEPAFATMSLQPDKQARVQENASGGGGFSSTGVLGGGHSGGRKESGDHRYIPGSRTESPERSGRDARKKHLPAHLNLDATKHDKSAPAQRAQLPIHHTRGRPHGIEAEAPSSRDQLAVAADGVSSESRSRDLFAFGKSSKPVEGSTPLVTKGKHRLESTSAKVDEPGLRKQITVESSTKALPHGAALSGHEEVPKVAERRRYPAEQSAAEAVSGTERRPLHHQQQHSEANTSTLNVPSTTHAGRPQKQDQPGPREGGAALPRNDEWPGPLGPPSSKVNDVAEPKPEAPRLGRLGGLGLKRSGNKEAANQEARGDSTSQSREDRDTVRGNAGSDRRRRSRSPKLSAERQRMQLHEHTRVGSSSRHFFNTTSSGRHDKQLPDQNIPTATASAEVYAPKRSASPTPVAGRGRTGYGNIPPRRPSPTLHDAGQEANIDLLIPADKTTDRHEQGGRDGTVPRVAHEKSLDSRNDRRRNQSKPPARTKARDTGSKSNESLSYDDVPSQPEPRTNNDQDSKPPKEIFDRAAKPSRDTVAADATSPYPAVDGKVGGLLRQKHQHTRVLSRDERTASQKDGRCIPESASRVVETRKPLPLRKDTESTTVWEALQSSMGRKPLPDNALAPKDAAVDGNKSSKAVASQGDFTRRQNQTDATPAQQKPLHEDLSVFGKAADEKNSEIKTLASPVDTSSAKVPERDTRLSRKKDAPSRDGLTDERLAGTSPFERKPLPTESSAAANAPVDMTKDPKASTAENEVGAQYPRATDSKWSGQGLGTSADVAAGEDRGVTILRSRGDLKMGPALQDEAQLGRPVLPSNVKAASSREKIEASPDQRELAPDNKKDSVPYVDAFRSTTRNRQPEMAPPQHLTKKELHVSNVEDEWPRAHVDKKGGAWPVGPVKVQQSLEAKDSLAADDASATLERNPTLPAKQASDVCIPPPRTGGRGLGNLPERPRGANEFNESKFPASAPREPMGKEQFSTHVASEQQHVAIKPRGEPAQRDPALALNFDEVPTKDKNFTNEPSSDTSGSAQTPMPRSRRSPSPSLVTDQQQSPIAPHRFDQHPKSALDPPSRDRDATSSYEQDVVDAKDKRRNNRRSTVRDRVLLFSHGQEEAFNPLDMQSKSSITQLPLAWDEDSNTVPSQMLSAKERRRKNRQSSIHGSVVQTPLESESSMPVPPVPRHEEAQPYSEKRSVPAVMREQPLDDAAHVSGDGQMRAANRRSGVHGAILDQALDVDRIPSKIDHQLDASPDTCRGESTTNTISSQNPRDSEQERQEKVEDYPYGRQKGHGEAIPAVSDAFSHRKLYLASSRDGPRTVPYLESLVAGKDTVEHPTTDVPQASIHLRQTAGSAVVSDPTNVAEKPAHTVAGRGVSTPLYGMDEPVSSSFIPAPLRTGGQAKSVDGSHHPSEEAFQPPRQDKTIRSQDMEFDDAGVWKQPQHKDHLFMAPSTRGLNVPRSPSPDMETKSPEPVLNKDTAASQDSTTPASMLKEAFNEWRGAGKEDKTDNGDDEQFSKSKLDKKGKSGGSVSPNESTRDVIVENAEEGFARGPADVETIDGGDFKDDAKERNLSLSGIKSDTGSTPWSDVQSKLATHKGGNGKDRDVRAARSPHDTEDGTANFGNKDKQSVLDKLRDKSNNKVEEPEDDGMLSHGPVAESKEKDTIPSESPSSLEVSGGKEKNLVFDKFKSQDNEDRGLSSSPSTSQFSMLSSPKEEHQQASVFNTAKLSGAVTGDDVRSASPVVADGDEKNLSASSPHIPSFANTKTTRAEERNAMDESLKQPSDHKQQSYSIPEFPILPLHNAGPQKMEETKKDISDDVGRPFSSKMMEESLAVAITSKDTLRQHHGKSLETDGVLEPPPPYERYPGELFNGTSQDKGFSTVPSPSDGLVDEKRDMHADAVYQHALDAQGEGFSQDQKEELVASEDFFGGKGKERETCPIAKELTFGLASSEKDFETPESSRAIVRGSVRNSKSSSGDGSSSSEHCWSPGDRRNGHSVASSTSGGGASECSHDEDTGRQQGSRQSSSPYGYAGEEQSSSGRTDKDMREKVRDILPVNEQQDELYVVPATLLDEYQHARGGNVVTEANEWKDTREEGLAPVAGSLYDKQETRSPFKFSSLFGKQEAKDEQAQMSPDLTDELQRQGDSQRRLGDSIPREGVAHVQSPRQAGTTVEDRSPIYEDVFSLDDYRSSTPLPGQPTHDTSVYQYPPRDAKETSQLGSSRDLEDNWPSTGGAVPRAANDPAAQDHLHCQQDRRQSAIQPPSQGGAAQDALETRQPPASECIVGENAAANAALSPEVGTYGNGFPEEQAPAFGGESTPREIDVWNSAQPVDQALSDGTPHMGRDGYASPIVDSPSRDVVEEPEMPSDRHSYTGGYVAQDGYALNKDAVSPVAESVVGLDSGAQDRNASEMIENGCPANDNSVGSGLGAPAAFEAQSPPSYETQPRDELEPAYQHQDNNDQTDTAYQPEDPYPSGDKYPTDTSDYARHLPESDGSWPNDDSNERSWNETTGVGGFDDHSTDDCNVVEPPVDNGFQTTGMCASDDGTQQFSPDMDSHPVGLGESRDMQMQPETDLYPVEPVEPAHEIPSSFPVETGAREMEREDGDADDVDGASGSLTSPVPDSDGPRGRENDAVVAPANDAEDTVFAGTDYAATPAADGAMNFEHDAITDPPLQSNEFYSEGLGLEGEHTGDGEYQQDDAENRGLDEGGELGPWPIENAAVADDVHGGIVEPTVSDDGIRQTDAPLAYPAGESSEPVDDFDGFNWQDDQDAAQQDAVVLDGDRGLHGDSDADNYYAQDDGMTADLGGGDDHATPAAYDGGFGEYENTGGGVAGDCGQYGDDARDWDADGRGLGDVEDDSAEDRGLDYDYQDGGLGRDDLIDDADMVQGDDDEYDVDDQGAFDAEEEGLHSTEQQGERELDYDEAGDEGSEEEAGLGLEEEEEDDDDQGQSEDDFPGDHDHDDKADRDLGETSTEDVDDDASRDMETSQDAQNELDMDDLYAADLDLDLLSSEPPSPIADDEEDHDMSSPATASPSATLPPGEDYSQPSSPARLSQIYAQSPISIVVPDSPSLLDDVQQALPEDADDEQPVVARDDPVRFSCIYRQSINLENAYRFSWLPSELDEEEEESQLESAHPSGQPPPLDSEAPPWPALEYRADDDDDDGEPSRCYASQEEQPHQQDSNQTRPSRGGPQTFQEMDLSSTLGRDYDYSHSDDDDGPLPRATILERMSGWWTTTGGSRGSKLPAPPPPPVPYDSRYGAEQAGFI